MKISLDKVVVLHYAVSDSKGVLIDSSFESDPLAFIHGEGYVIPGLETALIDHEAGDAFEVVVPSDDAYGPRLDHHVQAMPIAMFEGLEGLQVGTHLQADTDHGEQSVIVVAMTDDEVTVDANHPLAGLDLTFKVEIVDVRDASKEELDHGHVHGDGGCGH